MRLSEPCCHPCLLASLPACLPACLPLQAYLAFGDPGYLLMFKQVYASAMAHLQLDPQWNGNVW
jgi:hypothetical protein